MPDMVEGRQLEKVVGPFLTAWQMRFAEGSAAIARISDGPAYGRLSDSAVAVDIEAVDFLDLPDQVSQCVLCQLKLVLEDLDAILDRVGFSLLAVH
jgi:hypothetical protein